MMSRRDRRASSPSPAITSLGPTTSRRGFLAIAGMSTAGLALAACGSDNSSSSTGSTGAGGSANSTSATTAAGSANNVDLDTATLAAGLEVLAVGTYTAAAAAATKGALGTVPPAVGEYVKTALAHHQAALDKWNGVLKAGGMPAVTEPNSKLKPVVDAAFAKVTDANGAAALALMLEEIAAATYQKAVPTLKDKAAIELAGSLQVIDAQHVAVLLFVMGQYPVPEVFAKTDKAA